MLGLRGHRHCHGALLPAPHSMAVRRHCPRGSGEPCPRAETQPRRQWRSGALHWPHHLEATDPGDREACPSPNAGPLRHLHRALLSLKIIVDQLVNRPLPWWAQSHWILKFHSEFHSPIRTSLSGTPASVQHLLEIRPAP